MMRENMGLYHGKRVDNGEWVEGYFFETTTPVYRTFIIINMSVDVSDNYTDILDFNFVEVYPETVGQCSGLTDKNGKKIFEGNIVKAECDLYHAENKKERVTRIGTVVYDKKFCQFGINVAGFSKCYVLNRWKGDYNEIIGDIHDNPELLEGSKW